MADLFIGSEVFWRNEADRLMDIVYPEIQNAVNLGVLAGGEAIGGIALGVNYELINELAVFFAQQYSFALVTQINTTTVKLLQSYVADWIASGKPLAELSTTLATETALQGAFGASRAKLIAITETTRAYAEGNMLTWTQAGYVIGTEWRTVEDAFVDSICKANVDAGVVPLGEAYPSGHTNPPAHPGCRCYVSPVTRKY